MCTLVHTTQDAGFTSMNECAGQWLCQQDSSSTEEHLFEAFCFRDQLSEDYDPPFTRPTSHGNTFTTTWPVPLSYEELDVGMLNVDPKNSAGPTSQCTLNNSWKPSTELASEDAVHCKSLMQGTAATVEAELEEDIQREIEAELKKEISLLSQKLAVLQARHGAQRMMEGPLPAVLSCPVTPVLTPRDSKETNVQSSNLNQSDAGAIGTRHRRGGPIIAAKQARPKSEWKASMRPDILSPGTKQNEGMIHQDCSPQSNDCRQARIREEFNYGDEHSLEVTPSSGSLNSNITDYIMKDPTIQNSRGRVPCPREYPNNSRRFDWVKTLRSGEVGSRLSSGTSVSSDKKPLKIPKTKRPIETKAEYASKSQCDKTTGNRINDLSDMTEMLENRLSDLAIRTTMACVQIPAPQDLECTSSCGHVLTTKHAKYLEAAADKSTKDLGSSVLAEEDYGCLDRRTVLHLMKAGLKRGPIRKKTVHQSPYSKPRPVRTCNTHKDATNGKHGETASEKVSPEKQTQTDELKEIQQDTELVSPYTIKTERKTFVQSPHDRPKSLLHCDDSERLHATRNGNSNMLVQSNRVLSTQEKISQSQISILGSKEKQHPVKTTYMRIIELVADTGNQHSAKKSTHGSRQCLASDKGSLSSLLMDVKHRADDKTFKHDKGHISNITDTSSLTTSRLCENIASAFKKGGQETIKKTSQHHKFVSRSSEQLSPESHTNSMDRGMGCKSLPKVTLDVTRDGVKETIHKEEQTECLATNRPISATEVLRRANFREKACPHENWSPELTQDQVQLQEFDGKLNHAISSSSLNGENRKTDNDSAEASRPAVSSIRARLKELIDALEKERLRLPKIKTGTEASISTSPRDSGRVKRIAERLQLVNLKVDEIATPSDLHNNGQVYPEITARVITASCNKIEAKCTKSVEVAHVHDRQGQTTRKKTLQRQVLRVRRSGKQSRRAKDSNIQQNLNEDKKCAKKLRKKTTSTGNEIEGLNLESIWCLVEKLEGIRSSSAVASRTPARHMRAQHCEEGA